MFSWFKKTDDIKILHNRIDELYKFIRTGRFNQRRGLEEIQYILRNRFHPFVIEKAIEKVCASWSKHGTIQVNDVKRVFNHLSVPIKRWRFPYYHGPKIEELLKKKDKIFLIISYFDYYVIKYGKFYGIHRHNIYDRKHDISETKCDCVWEILTKGD